MPTALITGASRGIGRATALHLDALGWRVLAGYRDPADAEALGAAASDRLTPIPLDLTTPDDLRAAANAVAAGGLDALVNNAGIVVAGPLEFLPLDAIREQFEVNVFGTVALTQAMIPALRAARGRIVNVSSVNGEIVTPFAVPYAASKFALEAFTDGWRLELRRDGIVTISIQPGAIATPLWETSRTRAVLLAASYPPEARERYGRVLALLEAARMPARAIPPERVARLIATVLRRRRPRARYVIGRDARIGLLLRTLLPTRWFDALLAGRRRA